MSTSSVDLIDVALSESAWRRPDSVVVESPTWFQVTTPSAPVTGLNGVLRSALDEADADETLDATIRHYQERGLPFRWLVGPRSRPSDLAARLLARGLTASFDYLGLVADTAAIVRAAGSTPDSVSLELLRPETVDEFVDATMEGYGNPPEQRQALASDIARLVATESDKLVYVLARVDGALAGTGAVRYCKGSAYFIGTSVVPRFRKRGVYRALVGYRARLAEQAGRSQLCTLAVTTTSAPICLRLGFVEACRMTVFLREHAPAKDRS